MTDRKTIPTRNELRKFGLLMGTFVGGIFGVLLPVLFNFGFPLWPWIMAAGLILPALVRPQLLQPIERLWMRFSVVLGTFNTRLLLGLIFFTVITPFGIVRRTAGTSPISRRFRGKSSSYRINICSRNIIHMDKPF